MKAVAGSNNPGKLRRSRHRWGKRADWECRQPGGPVRVCDIMTPNPVCCTPDSTAREAATLMRDNDCGSIPVVENREANRLVGMVTDRDLAIRGFAAGKGPETRVRQLMTEAPITSAPEDEVEIVREVMVAQQVRRVPVVDNDGAVVGIV